MKVKKGLSSLSIKNKVEIKQKDDIDMICLGVIEDAYHMQGLVKIKTFTSNSKNICSLKCYDKEGNILIIEKPSKWAKNIYRIKGISNRTEAEQMIGAKIYTNRSELPELGEEEFYIEDLVGLPIRNMTDEQIGRIRGCYNFGAGDILELDIDGEVEMYLFTKENFPEVTKEFVRWHNTIVRN